jgi:hypothetical protein
LLGVGPCGDLFAVDADGSAIIQLTNASSEEQEPALTPCADPCS